MKSNLYQYQNEESIYGLDRLIINNLSFREYVDILNKVYKIEIADNDLITLSSIILGDTSKTIILNTNIFIDVTKQILVNNRFSYYNKYHKLNLKMAYTNDNIINTKHVYTYNEIIKLINENKIILLSFIIDMDDDNVYYDDYEYRQLYPLDNITYNNFINVKYIEKKYIPYIKLYLNNYFTKDKLERDKIKLKKISK